MPLIQSHLLKVLQKPMALIFTFVYDVRNKKLYQSDIEAPSATMSKAVVLTRNDQRENLSTFGFINDCYKMCRFHGVQVMSFYLIKIIDKYVCYETLHLLIRKGAGDPSKTHWTIAVDKIIESTLSN